MIYLGSALTGPALAENRTSSTLGAKALMKAYSKSILRSAVKRRSYKKTLIPITSESTTVISLYRKDDPPDREDMTFPQDKGYLELTPTSGRRGTLTRDTWVSLPSELGRKCDGAADPLLALQMVLGMPPEGGSWELIRFKVATRHVFRPCASGPSITRDTCSFNIPQAGIGQTWEDSTQAFVFQQMWSSYTKGFKWPGYPFTGMGWSYNWDPDADDPYGISEYVVRDGATISLIETLAPDAFCNAP